MPACLPEGIFPFISISLSRSIAQQKFASSQITSHCFSFGFSVLFFSSSCGACVLLGQWKRIYYVVPGERERERWGLSLHFGRVSVACVANSCEWIPPSEQFHHFSSLPHDRMDVLFRSKILDAIFTHCTSLKIPQSKSLNRLASGACESLTFLSILLPPQTLLKCPPPKK